MAKKEKETYEVKLCEYLTCKTKRNKNKKEGRNSGGEEILKFWRKKLKRSKMDKSKNNRVPVEEEKRLKQIYR